MNHIYDDFYINNDLEKAHVINTLKTYVDILLPMNLTKEDFTQRITNKLNKLNFTSEFIIEQIMKSYDSYFSQLNYRRTVINSAKALALKARISTRRQKMRGF